MGFLSNTGSWSFCCCCCWSIMTPCCIFVEGHPRKLPVKFHWIWPCSFRDGFLSIDNILSTNCLNKTYSSHVPFFRHCYKSTYIFETTSTFVKSTEYSSWFFIFPLTKLRLRIYHIKVILYSYLISKKMNERITDS